MMTARGVTDSVSSLRQGVTDRTPLKGVRHPVRRNPSVGPSVGFLLASFPGSEVVTDDEIELVRQARFVAEWNEARR